MRTGCWDIFLDTSHSLNDSFDEKLIEDYNETNLNIFGVKGVVSHAHQTEWQQFS